MLISSLSAFARAARSDYRSLRAAFLFDLRGLACFLALTFAIVRIMRSKLRSIGGKAGRILARRRSEELKATFNETLAGAAILAFSWGLIAIYFGTRTTIIEIV